MSGSVLTRYGVLGLFCLLLHASAGFTQESTQGDQPAPDSVEVMKGPLHEAFRRILRREPLFPGMREELEPLPQFFRDAQLLLYARSYYLDRNDPNFRDSDALAQGTALAYRSGWLRDRFSIGADLYSSISITGENEEDTLLLDGDDNITVLGQAYGQFRFKEQYVTLYRQRLDLPYVNARDNRMLPNMFEAYTLKGEHKDTFQYIVGHVKKIKSRNSDDFIDMSERAGVGGSRGLSMAGLLWSPRKNFHLGGIDHYVEDTLNVVYVESEYTHSFTDGVGIKFAFQFTDQRSVGADRLTGIPFDTHVVGGQIATSFKHVLVRAAFSSTASEERIRSPWGSYPGHIGLIQSDFNRAGEEAWLIGISYNFKALGLEGLSLFANYAEGNDARDPATGGGLPDQEELDLTIDYRFPSDWVPGLWIRLRGTILDQHGVDDIEQFRVVVNYDIPVF